MQKETGQEEEELPRAHALGRLRVGCAFGTLTDPPQTRGLDPLERAADADRDPPEGVNPAPELSREIQPVQMVPAIRDRSGRRPLA